jgi:DNA-binding CsgD family transcriptional regulator
MLDERRALSSTLAMAAFHGMTPFTDSVAWTRMDEEKAWKRQRESYELAHEISWRFGEADAQVSAALTSGIKGDYAKAFESLELGMELILQIGHRMELAFAEMTLGAIYLDLLAPERALEHLERALTLSQEGNARHLMLISTGFLVSADVALGELTRARTRLVQYPPGADISTQAQRHMETARVELVLAQGDVKDAEGDLERILASLPSGYDGRVIPRLWRLKARIAMEQKRLGEAQRLLSDAHDAALELGLVPQVWRIEALRAEVWLNGANSEARREHARESVKRARGHILELGRKLDEAELRREFERRALAQLPRVAPLTKSRAITRSFDGLTKRERQIAAFVAEGKSNREIAAALVLSERTVDAHVSNILGKLDFSSRAQVAVWATRKGLVTHATE